MKGITQNIFLAHTFHDIRTYINTISSSADFIQNGRVSNEANEWAESIKHSCDILLSIINEVVDFSKIKPGESEIKKKQYSLNVLVDDLCKLTGSRLSGKPVEFIVNTEKDVPVYLIGDEIKIRRVLLNILTNAANFTKEGTITLNISCKKVIQKGKTDLVNLIFTVIDTGIGIKQEDLDKIFDNYVRAAEKPEMVIGTGLGLSIAKILCKQLNGKISVKSEFSKGSTFTFSVKQEYNTERKHAPIKNKKIFSNVFNAEKKNILIVDDDEISLEVLKNLFAPHKANLYVCRSGRECLKLANSTAITKERLFDIVFMDQIMPDMDGIDATQKLHKIKEYSNVPVIALTANALFGIKDDFSKAGISDCLIKPVTPAALNAVLIKFLQKQNDRRETDRRINDRRKLDRRKHPTLSSYNESKLIQELSNLKGLDIEEGMLFFSGKKEAYFRVLRQFCENFNADIKEIEKDLKKELWKNYTIKIHSYKGAFAMLGLNDFLKFAEKLEIAGNAACGVTANGDFVESKKIEKGIAFCKKETSRFIEEMKTLYGNLLHKTSLMRSRSKKDMVRINIDGLLKKLAVLEEACSKCKLSAALKNVTDLLMIDYNKEINSGLKKLSKTIYAMEYAKAKEEIAAIREKIITEKKEN
ncbi:MAG: response regulator [Spirochaetaceae bacterium]|jgi:CheY-like chemotaxis protein/two-component sensor histidine kinase|nr:response regulator [Spirochaetaceae bacterium]